LPPRVWQAGEVQDEPDAAKLLDAVAVTLDEQVLPRTDPAAQHHVRVAANLCRIVAREITLDPDAEARARAALGALLGRDRAAATLWAELADQLTPDPAGPPDPALDQLAAAAHPVVLAIVRDKLAVAKPGYDDRGGDTSPSRPLSGGGRP
jgi:hypothetical protein